MPSETYEVTDCSASPSDELRRPGGLKGFWQRVKPATAQATRRVATPILRVAAQGLDRAKAAGHLTARKVIGLQRAANLPERMVEQSARSVLTRPMNRESDRAFKAGYRETAKAEIPYMFVPKQPEIEDRELGG